MGFRLPILFIFAMACAALPARARAAAPSDPLQTLRKQHPRLLLLDDDLDRLKKLIATDPLAGQWYKQLKARADKELSSHPIEHVLIGPRLLDKSRTALFRISLCAAVYRLDGDKRYADRARQEMLVAAAFADWNPHHFLDVAEMTHAMAIGYDWLYPVLSPEDRATIRKAIVELGLKEGLKVYQKHDWWSVAHHNWNQVCNGGMTAGALAVAEDEPELSREIVADAIKSIPLAMSSFAPDGGWAEGPGYWAYATEYNVFMLAHLQSALGSDFGLGKAPGFAETGNFRIQFVGPIGQTFNYADAHEGFGAAPQMFWFAREFHNPTYAAVEREAAAKNPGIFDLIWYEPGEAGNKMALPLDALFRGVDVAFMRSAWHDRDAVFIGFKGGDNRANHSHLDLGTFVLDAFGQRWALDLGSDNYNLPGYFGKQRYTYYRLATEGHNTLTINGENQDIAAKAPIVAWLSSASRSFAVADLSASYPKLLTQSRRGIALLNHRQVLIEDEIRAKGPVTATWNFHTAAHPEISPQGDSALLSQGGAKLKVTILSPAEGRFKIVSANPAPPQHQQPEVSNLTIALPGKIQNTRIVVLLQSADDKTVSPKVEPLDAWIAAGPLK